MIQHLTGHFKDDVLILERKLHIHFDELWPQHTGVTLWFQLMRYIAGCASCNMSKLVSEMTLCDHLVITNFRQQWLKQRQCIQAVIVMHREQPWTGQLSDILGICRPPWRSCHTFYSTCACTAAADSRAVFRSHYTTVHAWTEQRAQAAAPTYLSTKQHHGLNPTLISHSHSHTLTTVCASIYSCVFSLLS